MKRNNNILPILFPIILGCMILLAFVGCRSIPQPTPPVNVSEHTRDSVRTEYKHDSIYVDRWHTQYVKGDTVYVHDSIFTDRWHKLKIYDSIYIDNTDTIWQTVTVEKKGSMFLRNSGIALWVLLALLLIAIIIGIVLKFAK